MNWHSGKMNGFDTDWIFIILMACNGPSKAGKLRWATSKSRQNFGHDILKVQFFRLMTHLFESQYRRNVTLFGNWDHIFGISVQRAKGWCILRTCSNRIGRVNFLPGHLRKFNPVG